jgi:hypothetical protein
VKLTSMACLVVLFTTAMGATVCAGQSESEDYSLVCKGRILQSSDSGLKLGKLSAPFVLQVRFTGGETTWVDPKDKSETIYEDLILKNGDRISYGGRFKGSTYESSTTFDGPFKTTGRGNINWGYAKSLRAFTVKIGTDEHLCDLKDDAR